MQRAFQSAKLGSMTLKNRFFRSATHDYFGNTDGTISERQIEIIGQLARNNVGTIITAITSVRADGISEENQNRIDDDRYIESIKIACEAAHAYGSRIFIQLAHGGAKSKIESENTIYSPSAISLYDHHIAKEIGRASCRERVLVKV